MQFDKKKTQNKQYKNKLNQLENIKTWKKKKQIHVKEKKRKEEMKKRKTHGPAQAEEALGASRNCIAMSVT